MKKIFFLSLLVVTLQPLCAQLRLPALVRDSMILQRDTKVRIWGWASPKEKVEVKVNGRTYNTRAQANGNWEVFLAPTPAGGPYTMSLKGKNRIELKDILFGDVWFCSGQSNMVHQLNIHDVTYARVIAEANDPQIRQCWIPTLADLNGPRTELPAVYWKAAVGEDIRPFSAVAYFFAKKIHDKYKIPIGIINSSVGGTPIEAWTSEEGLQDFSSLISQIQKNKDTQYVNSLIRNNAALPRPAPPVDLGLEAKPTWYDPAYVPGGWRRIHIPGFWEDQGVKDLNGVVWYRKEIEIPQSMAGKPARVFLGRIVDADELYINGKSVGRTTYQYPQRRYTVPEGVLKTGKNLFVIRVTNNGGKGGFVPDKPYCIFSGMDTVSLMGDWDYKVGVVFRPFNGPRTQPPVNAPNQPTALYNAMVAPVIPYTIKGICWYQGESNAGRPVEYEALMKALIEDWRKKWNLGTLPFFYVQLPGFMDYSYLPGESNWARLRESQLKAMKTDRTGMAVAIDLGEWNDIHPDNKKDVGERLALWALYEAYGEKELVHSGPMLEKIDVGTEKITLHFTHIGSGLITRDGEAPAEFAIAGEDKKFVWAQTRLEGNKVVIWNDEVKNPKYVRYAWADNPVNPNLINKEGLPASPFRTDPD
ncbi:MAG: sialate O-acetylesterase [Chitinophagaceae bacterium]|nr:sialate O-acetylesterase [Chitinophagaceae bacterium]